MFFDIFNQARVLQLQRFRYKAVGYFEPKEIQLQNSSYRDCAE